MSENAQDFFSEQDKGEIVCAIKEAELRTSGEIMVHIENECINHNVLDRAATVFAVLNMQKTKLRNGVLFYLATKDHKFAILGDAGINNKVDHCFWQDVRDLMKSFFDQKSLQKAWWRALNWRAKNWRNTFPISLMMLMNCPTNCLSANRRTLDSKDTMNNRKWTDFRPFALVFLLLLISANLWAQIPARPNPPRLVNDFANMLPDGEERDLERKLVAYNDSTSTQIAVVTVNSLNGDAAFSVAHEILEKWGVGTKGKDNGIVLLVAKLDREAFISTGYGIEGTLTDALAKRVIERHLIPQFRVGNFSGGIDNATDAIISIMEGQYQAQPSDFKSMEEILPVIIFLLIILIFVVMPAITSDKRKGKGYTYSDRGVRGGSVIIFHDGDFDDFASGSGPFSGGGSWGGGFGGGGGGFGGFGGGFGGGGGAGGSW